MREASRNFSAIFVAFFVLLTAMPAFASDCTLGIFGNANMDDRIDEKDVAYLEGVIKGTNPATNLSDANYDGKIDGRDTDQIEKIIKGEEEELHILDGNGEPVTVHKPVERIVVEYLDNAELVAILNSSDKVVGIDYAVARAKQSSRS